MPPRISGLVDIIGNAFGVVFPLALVVAVLMFVFAGYMWITAAGDPQKTQQAQGTMTWAVLGIVFLSLLRMLLELLYDFLGVA